MMEKFFQNLACSNAWLSESVNGKLLAISEAQGSRGSERRPARKRGLETPGMKETLESYRSGQ